MKYTKFMKDRRGLRATPERGDLIRRGTTGQYINLVHEVSRVPEGLLITSVRYANTNGGQVRYLFGERSRRFIWNAREWWVVKEYTYAQVPSVIWERELTNNDDTKAFLLQRKPVFWGK